jgi:hypothetical protein
MVIRLGALEFRKCLTKGSRSATLSPEESTDPRETDNSSAGVKSSEEGWSESNGITSPGEIT